MKKQLEILDKELKLFKLDKSVEGVMLTGSVAYGTATENSDLDIVVLSDKDEFISKYVNDILVEIHFQKFETMNKKLELNSIEVYKYLYSKIIFDNGNLKQLYVKANEIYKNYKTQDKEKESIKYWLSSTKIKLLSAMNDNDILKLSYLVSTNAWKLLEGVWAINDKPMPPSSIAFLKHNELTFPLDSWFEKLFVGDVFSKANTMISMIDIVCEK